MYSPSTRLSGMLTKRVFSLLPPFTRSLSTHVLYYVAEVLTPICAPGAAYFSTILWAYKGGLNLFGVIMAAKTWNCADGVGEVRHKTIGGPGLCSICRRRKQILKHSMRPLATCETVGLYVQVRS